jgi:hypothetical protein
VADTFTQVPPNSTGNKLQMRSRLRGSDTVLQQAVYLDHAETWSAVADASAFAGSKHHISLYNAASSGVTLQIIELRWINLALTTVTGVGIRFDVRRFASAHSAGTLITPEAFDTANAALPAGVTVRTGATITTGNLIFPFALNNDEVPLTGLQNQILAQNIMPNHVGAGNFVLREGQGLTVQQITASVVGSFAWHVIFTSEPVIP